MQKLYKIQTRNEIIKISWHININRWTSAKYFDDRGHQLNEIFPLKKIPFFSFHYKKEYSIIIIFLISSVKYNGNLFSLVLQKHLHNILKFTSQPEKVKSLAIWPFIEKCGCLFVIDNGRKKFILL